MVKSLQTTQHKTNQNQPKNSNKSADFRQILQFNFAAAASHFIVLILPPLFHHHFALTIEEFSIFAPTQHSGKTLVKRSETYLFTRSISLWWSAESLISMQLLICSCGHKTLAGHHSTLGSPDGRVSPTYQILCDVFD